MSVGDFKSRIAGRLRIDAPPAPTKVAIGLYLALANRRFSPRPRSTKRSSSWQRSSQKCFRSRRRSSWT